MQQNTVEETDSTNSNDSGNKASSFEAILKSDDLKGALSDRTPNLLTSRLVEEIATGNNVLVEAETPTAGATEAIAIALADKALSQSEKTLIVYPTTQVIEKAVEGLSSLPITLAPASSDEPLELPSDAKCTAGDVSAASVIIGTFAAAEQLDLSSIKSIAFVSFSAGAGLPGSEEFEAFLEKAKDSQFCWCSESIPLTLNGAINRHIRVDGHSHINLEKESEVKLIHEFYEVGHELLAKPEALATLIEVEGRPRTAIFCNNPSETDLLEVLLKKRGIKARKLIGNVPDHAVRGAMEQVRNDEVEAVVLTDVSGRSFPIEEFDIVVHHAAPEDPEIYLLRLGHPDSTSRLKRVVSLVGSTDLGNFHFLKKVVEFDFVSKSLPSNEEVAKARFSSFQKQVSEFTTDDSEVLEYAKLIEESGDQKAFMTFLLHQFLKVLPEATSGKRDKRSRQSRDRYDRDDYEERSGGRDRGRNRDRGDRDERRERPEKKARPTRKDLRYYVGQGLKDNLTEEKFQSVLNEVMGDEAPTIERSCIRDTYAFFDFQQNVSEAVYEAMKEAELDSKPMHFIQAATLTVPLEEEEGEESEEKSAEAEGGEGEESAAPSEETTEAAAAEA